MTSVPGSARPPLDGLAIDEAVAAQLSSLQVLAVQVYADTYAPDGIWPAFAREVHERLSLEALEAELFAAGVRVLVARRGDRVVGFASLVLDAISPPVPVPVPAPSAEVGRLYVLPAFQRRGVGAALLRRCEATAARQGCATVWLTAYAGNHGALAFYRRQAYRDAGRTEYVFEDVALENRVFVRSLQTRS